MKKMESWLTYYNKYKPPVILTRDYHFQAHTILS